MPFSKPLYSALLLWFGSLLVTGLGAVKPIESYSQELIRKAENGDTHAQYDLGMCCSCGLEVEKNEKEAFKWFKKSAEGGDSDGQVSLGTCFDMGRGVDINPAEAVKWYRKSAEQGNAEGQSCLGTSYNNGTGVEKNLEEAFKWILKAAEQGLENAQWMTGLNYRSGWGVAENKAEAVKWFTKAAEQGNKYAEEQLIKIQSNVDLPKAPIIMRIQTPSAAIAWLTDPKKLATLTGERAANSRLQKCVYWLAYAEEQGEKPEAVLDESAKLNKTEGTPYAGCVRWGLLENLKIAKELGLLNPEGMAELRRGDSAAITKGQYAGQEAEAGLVIPKAVCPELQNQVMNLELIPASLNRAKSDKVTDRAKVFAKELYEAKLLSEEGWERVSASSSK